MAWHHLFWSLPVLVPHSLQLGCSACLQSDRNAHILNPGSLVQAGNPHPSCRPCRGGTAGSEVQIVPNYFPHLKESRNLGKHFQWEYLYYPCALLAEWVPRLGCAIGELLSFCQVKFYSVSQILLRHKGCWRACVYWKMKTNLFFMYITSIFWCWN